MILLAVSLAHKQHAMEAAMTEAGKLDDDYLRGDATASAMLLRSAEIAAEAEKLNDEADGLFAAIAGDPGKLRELADRMKKESDRLKEGVSYLASIGQP